MPTAVQPQIKITGLGFCQEEVRNATLEGDTGPADTTNFSELMGRLVSAKSKLPPLYRMELYEPFIHQLSDLGQDGFNEILLQDPKRESVAGLMLDIAHAILQNGEKYQEVSTDAFQELVSDLYDGFLSAEDRYGISKPPRAVFAPLVKWGRPKDGPYTWTYSATKNFGVNVPIVNLPPVHSRKGIIAWSAIGHETSGHDVLHAYDGFHSELAEELYKHLKNNGIATSLAGYWAERIDETASDVLGILNMGPAAGIGVVAYFRGLNAAWSNSEKLRNTGSASDPHPADIVRGYLAAEVIRRLNFSDSEKWAKIVENETDNDYTAIKLAGIAVSKADAQKSAKLVAEAVASTRTESLERHALEDVQNWRDTDEAIVDSLRQLYRTPQTLPDDFASGVYAAHAVAAAVYEAIAVSGTDKLPLLFERMISILKQMHDRNASWGPLYVSHPSNIFRVKTYEGREAPNFKTRMIVGS